MSTIYTGVPANGARSPYVTPQLPSDGDTINVASVNSAIQELADYIAWLQLHTPGLDEANTFSAQQTLSALLVLQNSVMMSLSGAQAIEKMNAGGLTIGTTATGGDFSLKAAGTVLLKLLASGSLDAQGKVLGNLAAPSANSDAATKAYANVGQIVARGRITINNGGTCTIEHGINIASASWSTSACTIMLTTSLATYYPVILVTPWRAADKLVQVTAPFLDRLQASPYNVTTGNVVNFTGSGSEIFHLVAWHS